MDARGGPPPHQNVPSAQTDLEQQKLDLLGPAYVVEQARGQQQCARRRIADAEELRAGADAERRLFVIRGPPAEYRQVLEDALSVDRRFVEAHVGRRSYRPWVGRRPRRRPRRDDNDAAGSASFACFEYPELLAGSQVPPNLLAAAMAKQAPGQCGSDKGAGGDPPAYAISAEGGVVVFRCASLWLGPKADVLLLDQSVRAQQPPPPPKPAPTPYRLPERNRASTFGDVNEFRNDGLRGSGDKSDNANDDNDQGAAASFEALLHESLAEDWGEGPGDDALRSLVEDVAVHQWTELFEALSAEPPTPGPAAETVATNTLFWQMQKSLEKNLSASQFYDKSFALNRSSPSASTSADWEALLSRLGRYVELRRQLAPPSIVAAPVAELPPSPEPAQPVAAAAVYPPPRRRRRNDSRSSGGDGAGGGSSSSEDKNQHSLDRVSYMGGVLLPLSIVSSILSMSDPFGPGGSMFFVFWAVSVPLVLVTIFVIYADTIRRAEVWIEVAAAAGASDVENPEEKDDRNGATPYGAAIQLPVVEPKTGRTMGTAALGDDYAQDPDAEWSFDEPSVMAEKMFRTTGGKRKWQKQQLGWKGACMTAIQLYKLKKGRPPNWPPNARREHTY
ncbi:hypothetical protein GGR52DRAFT_567723 [Hypoxylon sp. FL1284]|nr:hypothetical protein GGR52DRAFT_567723 [Hypoxylon sp. FL1284]